MEGNRAHQVSTKSDTSSSTSKTRAALEASGNRVPPTAAYGVEWSTGCCRSCVAGAVADGVAICCCCPCAVVNLVAFLLVRVPWMLGRRCIAMARGKKNRKRRRNRAAKCGGDDPWRTSSGMSCNYVEKWRVHEGIIEVTTSFEEGLDEESDDVAEERAWLELCRGFGRLSFTGIQSAGKGSLVNSQTQI